MEEVIFISQNIGLQQLPTHTYQKTIFKSKVSGMIFTNYKFLVILRLVKI